MISAKEAILIFAAVVLACGSAGLLIARLSNPTLKGLGWLGGSFAAAGAGALLFLVNHNTNTFSVAVVADLLVMAAFVLLHVAILELVEARSLFPALGVGMLGLQAVVSVFSLHWQDASNFRVALMGLLIAAQATQTALRLFQQGKRTIRVPAWFCATILFWFVSFNVARSLALAAGLLSEPRMYERFEAMTFALYLAVALGLAFGFFWMTTTMLTQGLESMASTDPLTRLYNRRVFLLWCEKELVRTQRIGEPFSVLMMDLDHFKQINDTFGHQTGDRALCAAVENLQDSMRGIDVLGRWGGEEFSALLPSANTDSALVVAERVRSNVERIQMSALEERDGHAVMPIRMTVSVGVATYRGAGDTVQAMLQRADMNLYRAKALGRNRVLAGSEGAVAAVSGVTPWPVVPATLMKPEIKVPVKMAR